MHLSHATRRLITAKISAIAAIGCVSADRVIERVNVLPDDATLCDVTQVFTQLANGNVNYRTANRLQRIGGDLAFDIEHVVHRCGACERLLPEDV